MDQDQDNTLELRYQQLLDERKSDLKQARDTMVSIQLKALESFERTLVTLIGGSLAGSMVYVEKAAHSASQPLYLVLALCGFGLSLIVILLSMLLTATLAEREIEELIDKELSTGEEGKMSANTEKLSNWIGGLNWIAFAMFSTGLIGLIIFVILNAR